MATSKLGRTITNDIQKNLDRIGDTSNLSEDQIDRFIDELYLTKSQLDDDMSLMEILKSGPKLKKTEVEYEGYNWVDEHSGTFSWRTKSQENLCFNTAPSAENEDPSFNINVSDYLNESTRPKLLDLSPIPPSNPTTSQPPGIFSEVMGLFDTKKQAPAHKQPEPKDRSPEIDVTPEMIKFNINKSNVKKQRSPAPLPEKPPRKKSTDRVTKKPPPVPAPPAPISVPPVKPPRRSSQERSSKISASTTPTGDDDFLKTPVFDEKESVPKTGFDFLDNW